MVASGSYYKPSLQASNANTMCLLEMRRDGPDVMRLERMPPRLEKLGSGQKCKGRHYLCKCITEWQLLWSNVADRGELTQPINSSYLAFCLISNIALWLFSLFPQLSKHPWKYMEILSSPLSLSESCAASPFAGPSRGLDLCASSQVAVGFCSPGGGF